MCPSEVSEIQAGIWEVYGDDGVVVWAIASEEPEDDVERFADQLDLDLPVLLDADGTVRDLYQGTASHQTAPYPQEWIIGPDGRVLHYANELDLDAAIAVIEEALEG